MSQDFSLYIPPYVPTEHILKILGQYYRDEKLVKATFSSNDIDTNKPSSPNNRWYFNYPIKCQAIEYSYGSYICHPTILDKEEKDFSLSFFIHTDACLKEEEYMGYKLISGSSWPFGLAGAKRLLEMCGGKLIYCDNNEDVYEVCREPVLSKDFFKHVDHERYFDFINMLDKMPSIKLSDLIVMQNFAYYPAIAGDLDEFEKRYEKVLIRHDKALLGQLIEPVQFPATHKI